MKEWEVLTDSEIDQIHTTALEILANVGVKIANEDARKLLAKTGADVNHNTTQVKFTDEIIENCIRKAPDVVTYGARDEELDLVMKPDGKVYSHPPAGLNGIIDVENGKFKSPTTQDAIEWIELCDGLENIDSSTSLYPSDVSDKIRDIYITRLLLEHTSKHIHVSPYSGKNLEYIVKLVLTIQSVKELKVRPIVSVVASTKSPLQYSENAFEVLSLSGKYGIPVEMATMPMAGATSPVTMAGVITLAHAELLTAITLSQVANPGAPLIAFPLPSFMNMQNGNIVEGGVENAMMSAALVQIMRKCCNIPVNVFGLVTDALQPDGQSMIERSFNVLLPALAGANIVSGAGQVEHCYTGSLTQLVIDNDILGMELKALKGISVNEESLGLEAIKRTRPNGNFLADKHTLKHFKTEYFRPELFTTLTRDDWKAKGAQDLHERAKEKVKDILATHEVFRLPDHVANDMNAIVEEAKQYDWSRVSTAIW